MEFKYQVEGSSSTFTHRALVQPTQRCLQNCSKTGVWKWGKSLCKHEPCKTVQSQVANVRYLAEKQGDELGVCPQCRTTRWSPSGLQSHLRLPAFLPDGRAGAPGACVCITETSPRCNFCCPHSANEGTAASEEWMTRVPPRLHRGEPVWGHSKKAATCEPGGETSPQNGPACPLGWVFKPPNQWLWNLGSLGNLHELPLDKQVSEIY